MKNIPINKLIKIMEKLRDPEKGCPWDKIQTMETIIPYSIEEVYEVQEQILKKNYIKLKDELGDLLFQVIYLSQIASEKKKFNFKDVVDGISNKMIKRHPHVFGKKKFHDAKSFKKWWEKSKNKKINSLLDDIPKTFPAHLESYKIQKKVAENGFDYKNIQEALKKVSEELEELKYEIKIQNKRKIKEELGDLIFSTLDVSRKLNFNPENILKTANIKFIKRWKKLEKNSKKEKLKLENLNIKEYNKLWKISKK